MKALYTQTEFTASLHDYLLCTNDPQCGTKVRSKATALKHDYIQFNDNYIKFLWLDLDHEDVYIWEKVGLPAPNFVVRNKDNCRSHLVWALEAPIYKDYESKAKNLYYFAKIQQAFTEKAKADTAFVGLIGKNPVSDNWHVFQPNRHYPYTLDELADYVELPQHITKKQALGEGRNCWLFDTVRKWAYKEVLFYKTNQATQNDFYNVVLNRLEKINMFENAPPLDFNELKGIAKSVSKWTWKHFSAEKFSEIQQKRSHKWVQVNKSQIAAMEFLNEFS